MNTSKSKWNIPASRLLLLLPCHIFIAWDKMEVEGVCVNINAFVCYFSFSLFEALQCKSWKSFLWTLLMLMAVYELFPCLFRFWFCLKQLCLFRPLSVYIVFVLGVHCTHTHKHTHSNGKFIIFSFYIDPIHSLRFNISFKYILHRILFGFFIDFAIVIQSTKVPVLVDVEPMVSVCVERRRYFAFINITIHMIYAVMDTMMMMPTTIKATTRQDLGMVLLYYCVYTHNHIIGDWTVASASHEVREMRCGW